MTRFALALAMLLAGCARSEDAQTVAPDSAQGYNRAGRVQPTEADDREPAIGQWRAALQDDRPALEFGPMGTQPLFSLLCAPAGGVMLQRHGGVPTGPLPAMRVIIGDVTQDLPVSAGGGTIPLLQAAVPAGSPLLQALVVGAEPLQVRLGDAAPTIMPPSPLVADYLRSCGRGTDTPGGGNAAAPATAGPSTNGAAPAPGNAAAPAP